MAGKNHTHYTDEDRIAIIRDKIEGGLSIQAAATKHGVGQSSIERWGVKFGHVAKIKDGVMPEGHDVKGTSTLYDKDGEIKLQWVKTNKDLDKAKDILNDVAESLKKEIPKQRPTKAPKQTIEDLLSCYVITDYHFGMLAWGQETHDDNWNLDVASELLLKWFAAAIKSAPDSKVGVFMQMGDYLHYDGLEALTPASGHVLDADSRFPKLVDTIIKITRHIINMLLEKHEQVHIIMAEGNHDLASSVWLRALFAEKYADEPRITVDNTHTPYYAYEWGQTSLFVHHGHKSRIAGVSKVFAGMYRDLYGRTKYSYVHTGHAHHKDVKEDSMMIVEQHQTLAAKDAYASRGGWLSKRSASVITYSKKYGEVGRINITPEMIDDKNVLKLDNGLLL